MKSFFTKSLQINVRDDWKYFNLIIIQTLEVFRFLSSDFLPPLTYTFLYSLAGIMLCLCLMYVDKSYVL